MKIVVTMGDGGHFEAANLADKQGCLAVLFAVQDGEYYDYVVDGLEEEDYKLIQELEDGNKPEISDEKWESLMQSFEQRGTFEIVSIAGHYDTNQKSLFP